MNQRSASGLQKVVAGLALATAFVVMASVFTPERSKAGDQGQSLGPGGAASATNELWSSNPHQGLRSLGSLQCNGYMVHIYSTEGGPRYSVYERSTGREMGTLLTLEKANQWFPELKLPATDFSATGEGGDSGMEPLMLAEPENTDWMP